MLPALVLTAGLGTRLDPITRLVAKAAVPLAGRTLIERSLARLSEQGVRDAVLNLHHRPESITSIVGDGTSLGLRVRYSWEPVILGSAGGPRRALPLIEADQFLIVNGDTLCDVDLADMISAHRTSGADVTMAVVANPAPDHYNGMLLDAERRVTAFVPRGQAAGSWHFIGIQVVEARVFEGLKDGVPEETVSGIYRERVRSVAGDIRGYCLTLPFVDVGTPRDYLAAAFDLAGARTMNVIEPGATVDSSARLTRCLVWNNAAIGPDAALSDCIVAGVEVPGGFRAESAILVPASIAKAGDAATITGNVAAFQITR